jgi:glycosyltransferase involved in cell wall biosynthesis
MRILVHCPPPWAPSGYGNQARLNIRALQAMGHEVAASIYCGVHEDGREWQGIPVLNASQRPYGNTFIAGNYRRWDADAMIIICDAWAIEPTQLAGLTVLPWMPVDCEPLSARDRQWLAMAGKGADIRPVAMSRHGQAMLADHGVQAPLVHHGIELDVFRPDPEAGWAWREANGVPAEMFLVAAVGVNDSYPGRKALDAQLQAFAAFAKGRNAAMYMHTVPEDPAGVDLVSEGLELGLKGKLKFCDRQMRELDLFGADYMRGMFNAADLFTQTSMGEGFGLPVIEAQACGTPVVATRCSAQTELVPPSCGTLVSGQRHWSQLHNAWWTEPFIHEITKAYERWHLKSRPPVTYTTCVRNAARFDINVTSQAWKPVLDGLAK